MRLPFLFRLPPGATPSRPAHVPQWLQRLPMLNKVDATRDFFNGLQAINGTDIAPKARLKILERLTPTARNMIRDLSRQLAARSLPLPAKSRRTLHQLQALLRQMALGYERCAIDALTAERPDPALATLACHRALCYLSEIASESAKLYAPDPPGLWAESKRLHALAREHGLQARTPAHARGHAQDPRSIDDLFKASLLLAISSPHSLRRQEVQRLADYFKHAAPLCDLTEQPVADSSGGAFLLAPGSDEPPHYALLSEATPLPGTLSLNLTRLQRDLREIAQGSAPGPAGGPDRGLARRVIGYWAATASKRRFIRSPRGEAVRVAVGLNNVRRSLGPPAEVQPPGYEIDIHRTRGRESADLDAAEVWDLLARGNVITEAEPEPSPAAMGSRASLYRSSASFMTWTVRDAGPGGYALGWRGEQASPVQVEDLIAVRDCARDHAPWELGRVRWMKSEESGELLIGVQLLAQRALPADVTRVHNRSLAHAFPIPALLVPPSGTHKAPSLVVPGHSVASGDDLSLRIGRRDLRVQLERATHQSASFNVFRCSSGGF
jgi:hypothetical protein